MREIKFRAWDKEAGHMLDWDSICHEPVLCASLFGDFLIPLQYTGLTDKNGVEIYEGDIVQDNSPALAGEVYWDDVLAGFDTTSRKPDENDDTPIIVNNPTLEVIGNIYENPELLK